jgi:hypothetical protein
MISQMNKINEPNRIIYYGNKKKRKKSRMIRFKMSLRDKEMWKNLAIEGSIVIIVAMILLIDPLSAWVSKPSFIPNGIEIVEKTTCQIATKITDMVAVIREMLSY